MNNLRLLREDRDMSQADLAKAIGAAQNTISNWERGNREIDNPTLLKLADLFEVSIDFILGRTLTSYWDDINQDRSGFLASIKIKDKTAILKMFGLDIDNPYQATIPEMLSFVDYYIEWAQRKEDGTWDVRLKNEMDDIVSLSNPASPNVGDDLKAALFGGDGEITDEMWDDVKRYAAFIKARKEEMSNGDGKS